MNADKEHNEALRNYLLNINSSLSNEFIKPKQEIEMTEYVLAQLDVLLKNKKYDHIMAEVPTASSIADLAVIQFDKTELTYRENNNIEPIYLPLRMRTLDMISNKNITNLGTLASRVGSNSKALTRSTINPLVEAGIIRVIPAADIHKNKIKIIRKWQPLSTSIITFELKLTDWRKAFQQARSQAISANYSWVIMNGTHTDKKIKTMLDEFDLFESNIGLAVLDDDGKLAVYRHAKKNNCIRWLNTLMGEMMWKDMLD